MQMSVSFPIRPEDFCTHRKNSDVDLSFNRSNIFQILEHFS